MGELNVRKIFFSEVSIAVFIASTVLGAFIYLTRPASDNYTALQLQDQRITAQRLTIDELTKTQQNDMKEIKNEMAGLRTEVQSLTNNVVKLQTILEERVPTRK